MTMLGSLFNKNENNRITAKARKLADILHDGQTDHTGNDYILHPERVVNNLLRIYPDASSDMICAAWLHDVMEDCEMNGKKVDEDFLRSQEIPEAAIKMVRLLTKPDDDKRSYEEVIDDLIASDNVGAMIIKIADNMDNLHPVRKAELRAVNPDKAKRLQDRYLASVQKLCHATGISIIKTFQAIANSPALKTEFRL
ncbi:MAG: HD domain-containing protein [Alphaproteobacteria bacterium]|nr:HD domain-containing protein [Alphaproteobacteria bacterium]